MDLPGKSAPVKVKYMTSALRGPGKALQCHQIELLQKHFPLHRSLRLMICRQGFWCPQKPLSTRHCPPRRGPHGGLFAFMFFLLPVEFLTLCATYMPLFKVMGKKNEACEANAAS